MEEQWKDIYGYEGLYQVSNLGNVKSLKGYGGVKERMLKPRKDKDGYLMVDLQRKNYKIHRLVAYAFIPNDDLFKTDINHKSEVKTDNRVENLEWIDHKSNNNYGTRNLRMSKTKSMSVQQYSLDGVFLKTWQSLHEIERQLGFNSANIWKCCKGKIKTSYGYIWKYKNEEQS